MSLRDWERINQLEKKIEKIEQWIKDFEQWPKPDPGIQKAAEQIIKRGPGRPKKNG